MANSTQILDGFYKGIPIRIDSGSTRGGRKTVIKQFPNRDTQEVEDLGLKPRTYNLQIVIAPRTTVSGGITNTSQNYFEYRDSIIAAIENKGAGELIHPLYGRIDNVVATTYSLNEDFSDFGRSRLDVTFESTEELGIPRQTATAISQLSQANNAVNLAVISDISDNFSVLDKFKENFSDAANKINEIVDQVVEATSFLTAASDQINEFNSFVGELTADVNRLIGLPDELALSVTNLFSNIDTLFSTITFGSFDSKPSINNADAAIDATTSETGSFLGSPSSEDNTTQAFAGLFGFGNNDETEILDTTAGRIERKKNRAVLNGSVNALALSYAYVNVAQVEFNNVRELEAAADELELQYERVLTSGSSDNLISKVTDMRVIVQQFFDEQKVNLKQIVLVNVNTMPARVLSYQYYAESDGAVQIVDLNDISDVSFVNGDVEIVSV